MRELIESILEAKNVENQFYTAHGQQHYWPESVGEWEESSWGKTDKFGDSWEIEYQGPMGPLSATFVTFDGERIALEKGPGTWRATYYGEELTGKFRSETEVGKILKKVEQWAEKEHERLLNSIPQLSGFETVDEAEWTTWEKSYPLEFSDGRSFAGPSLYIGFEDQDSDAFMRFLSGGSANFEIKLETGDYAPSPAWGLRGDTYYGGHDDFQYIDSANLSGFKKMVDKADKKVKAYVKDRVAELEAAIK